MQCDYLIIGSGIASISAIESIRSKDASGSIVLISREQHRLYSRVLLPNLAKNKIPEEKIWLRTLEWYSQMKVEVLFGVSVASISTSGALVAILHDDQEIVCGKILIATGGTPRQPEFKFDSQVEFFNLQTFEDAVKVRDFVGKSAVVFGGGFIALELIMACHTKQMEVTSIMRNGGFFGRILGVESQTKIHETLLKNGVKLRLNSPILGVESVGKSAKIYLQGESTVADVLGMGIGLEFNIGFLKHSGIETSRGVVVNEFLETNIKNVYVAGDVAEFFDTNIGTHRLVGNWGNAVLQGKTAGLNMVGANLAYSHVTSYGVSCFGLPITFLGAVDCAHDQKVIRQEKNGAVVELMLHHNQVIGATCVGMFPERAAILKLISGKVAITLEIFEALGNVDVLIGSLI